MKNDGVDIGGRENGLQGKTPCGFFFVGHTLEMTGVAAPWSSGGIKVRNSRVVCAVVIAEKGESRYNI